MFNNLKKIKWSYFLLWTGLMALIIILHFDHSFNADEGVTLNGAWNLFNNRQLYSDFYEFIPPGSFYLILFAWKIFGVSFLVAKVLSIICLFFGIVGLYKTGQMIIKNRITTFLMLLSFILISCWWPLINHNTFDLTFLIWACYFFIKGLSSLENNNFLISGLLTGASILFLQQKGLMFLIFSCLFLTTLSIVFRKKVYLKFSLIYTLASLVPLLLFCFWPLKAVFYNLIQYPMFGYITVNKISYNLFITSFIVWFVFLGMLLLKKEKTIKVWFLMIIQFGLLLITYPLPDFFHISLVLFPLLLIAFSFINKSLEKTTKFGTYFLFSVFFAAILCPLFIFSLMTNKFTLVAQEYDLNYKLVEYINSNCPGKYLYTGPFAPSFYFETRKLNATPYSVLITRQQSPEQFSEALSDFKKNKPSCAVLIYPNYLKRFEHDSSNQLEKYIRENYKLIYQPLDYLFVYKNL